MAQSEVNKTNCSSDILLLRMYSCTLKIFSTDQIRYVLQFKQHLRKQIFIQMIIRPSQLSCKVSLTYFFLTKSFSRKHVLPQVNACQEKKERKAPASAAAGLKKIHKLQATYTSELITIHNPNISIYLFFCNCIFSIQETKLEDHSPSQVKEKTLQPLDIGFYRLGMQAAMARLTTVCKKPILLDIRSMVTVLICSITSFFLGYEKPSAR